MYAMGPAQYFLWQNHGGNKCFLSCLAGHSSQYLFAFSKRVQLGLLHFTYECCSLKRKGKHLPEFIPYI